MLRLRTFDMLSSSVFLLMLYLMQLRNSLSSLSPSSPSISSPLIMMGKAFSCLATRTPSFLAEPAWLTTPWRGTRKDIHDEVIDILLGLPRIFQQTDVATASQRPSDKLTGLLKSVKLCWETDAALRDWFARLDDLIPGPLFWSQASTITTSADTPESGRLFHVSYRFPIFIIGYSLVVYWVNLTLVNHHLCRLYQGLQLMSLHVPAKRLEAAPCTCSDDSPDGPGVIIGSETTMPICIRHFRADKLPPLGLRLDWARTTAYEVCRSAEYFLDDKMGALGPSCLFSPMRVLRVIWARTPGDWTRQQAWTDDIIAIIQAKGNYIARYMQGEDNALTKYDSAGV